MPRAACITGWGSTLPCSKSANTRNRYPHRGFWQMYSFETSSIFTCVVFASTQEEQEAAVQICEQTTLLRRLIRKNTPAYHACPDDGAGYLDELPEVGGPDGADAGLAVLVNRRQVREADVRLGLDLHDAGG